MPIPTREWIAANLFFLESQPDSASQAEIENQAEHYRIDRFDSCSSEAGRLRAADWIRALLSAATPRDPSAGGGTP